MEDDEDLILESAERGAASKIQLRCSAITTSILICYFHDLITLLPYVSDRITSTRALSIASISLPSCPMDPSDGGTSIERKICFLNRRAARAEVDMW